jgi:hypothetical protein
MTATWRVPKIRTRRTHKLSARREKERAERVETGKQHTRVVRTKSGPARISVDEEQWRFLRAFTPLHILLKIKLTDADMADLARAL